MPITHGSQLTPADVGPWSIQGVAQGSETMHAVISTPVRGFYRFDTPAEFIPASNWPTNANDSDPAALNATSLTGGTVTADCTIDGYLVKAGTQVVQFTIFPDTYNFDAQGVANVSFLFRGCRFRGPLGPGDTGLFNDSTAPSTQHIYMHYCDVGLSSLDPTDGGFGASIIRNIGGSNHRYLRGYHTISATFFQPNVPGIAIVENYIDEFLYPYGDGGTQGIIPNPDAGHLNGISSEGGMTSIQILRNHIIAESPDGATGSTGSALGHIGYGTQVGQSGYGAGTNPGRLIASTDCIALFTSNGQPNIGDGITDLQIKDNYLGGTGYALYAGNTTAQGVICTGNTFTTKYWPNSGQFGPVTYEPAWGSNGNVATGNLWADDYGTSPHPGSDLLATRQYPTGNGPRTGAVIFGTDVTTLTNNFSGGTNGTTITAGNSGGASGNAFDSVIAQFGGAVTYDNTQTHLSSLSALLGVAGNSNASVNWTTALGTQTKIYFRDYLYLGGYSTGFSLYVISPLPSSGFSGNVIIDGAGTIKYLDNNGTAQITMTTTAPLNAWFRLEGFQDTTLGQVSLSLYLTPDSSTPDETHTTATGGSFGLSMVGLEFSANQSGAGPTFSVWVTGVGVSNVGPLGPIVPPATGSIPGHFYPFTGTRANHPFKPFH